VIILPRETVERVDRAQVDFGHLLQVEAGRESPPSDLAAFQQRFLSTPGKVPGKSLEIGESHPLNFKLCKYLPRIFDFHVVAPRPWKSLVFYEVCGNAPEIYPAGITEVL
jgi:hypothetical protein